MRVFFFPWLVESPGIGLATASFLLGLMLLFVMVSCGINQVVKFQLDQSSIYPPGN